MAFKVSSDKRDSFHKYQTESPIFRSIESYLLGDTRNFFVLLRHVKQEKCKNVQIRAKYSLSACECHLTDLLKVV